MRNIPDPPIKTEDRLSFNRWKNAITDALRQLLKEVEELKTEKDSKK